MSIIEHAAGPHTLLHVFVYILYTVLVYKSLLLLLAYTEPRHKIRYIRYTTSTV